MRSDRHWVGFGLISLIVAIPGCWPAPLAWSPDGKWLAHVTVERTSRGVLSTSWLYDPPGIGTPEPRREMERLGEPKVYRIWATRSDNTGSVKIDESPLPLTSPAWNPRGNAIAYGKVAKLVDGRLEFQILIQDTPERRKILVSQPLDEVKPEFSRLPALAPAWSPDGRYLAVPRFAPTGLAIIQTDTGQILKTLEDAYLPSWSPDSTRLAFVRGNEVGELYCLDPGFGSQRLLTEVGAIGQAPTWSRDGLHILTIRGVTLPGDTQKPKLKATLVRVNAESGNVELIRNLENNRFGTDPILPEVSAVLDRDGENLFFTASNGGLNTIILWVQTRTNSVRNQFNPIHLSIPIGAMALQPAGDQLAIRLGTGSGTGPVALLDPQTTKITPVAPDIASRLDWIRMLVALARHNIAINSPEVIANLPAPARPTSLPLPGESASNSELTFKLKSIGQWGGPLCLREGDETLDQETKRILTEAKLYFAYLRGDFAVAVATLDDVEALTTTRDHRLKLMGLRAQIDMANGDVDSAAPVIEYLRSLIPPKVYRYESTPSGPVLTAENRAGLDWPTALAERMESSRLSPLEEDKTDHTNFDAPQPGVGLDPAKIFPDIPDRPFRLRSNVP